MVGVKVYLEICEFLYKLSAQDLACSTFGQSSNKYLSSSAMCKELCLVLHW